MKNTVLRIVQLSDTHILNETNQTLLGINTRNSFLAVIETLRSYNTVIDAMILTGDLSQDGSYKSYDFLINTLKNEPYPVYWLPGNHDDLHIIAEALSSLNQPSDKQIVCSNWQLLLVNSIKNPHVEGYISDNEYQFIESKLKTFNHHTAIFLHHPILPIGSPWVDNLRLTDSNRFLSLMNRYPHVRLVVSGHVHQVSEQVRHNVTYLTAPSTCFQFLPNTSAFTLDFTPPGYRVLELYNDGTFSTEIIRARNYKEIPDESRKHY